MLSQLVIDRSKWRSGALSEAMTGQGPTLLLNKDGFMCCLGFESLRLGMPPDKIFGESRPYYYEEWEGVDPNWISKALNINDNIFLSRDQREAMLIDHFRERDIELTFEGEYHDP